MSGVLYGIGVGPGDPELMTVKAINKIKECEVLAIPVSDASFTEAIYEAEKSESQYSDLLNACVAYQIAVSMLPEIEKKAKLYLPMPMIKVKEQLKVIHDKCAAAASEQLEAGKDIAFITLGDPTVYSTCLYVHKRIKKMGYQTALIPGVPSFCAAAARMNIGLVENKEQLHVIPGSYEIETGLELPGTKVLMKAGRKIPYVKQTVKKKNLEIEMVENCGMENERIYRSADEIPDDAGYYSLIMIKENDQ